MRTERPEVRKIMELTGAHFFFNFFFFYEKKWPDVTALSCIVDGLGIDVACFVKKNPFCTSKFCLIFFSLVICCWSDGGRTGASSAST